MTCVIECVRPGLRASERFESTGRDWAQLLGLALTHGWLPQGATAWHNPEGQITDYSAADWLHAKTISDADAGEIAKALRARSVTHAHWPIADQFAAYCEGGGFVFAREETHRSETAPGATRPYRVLGTSQEKF
jgi:hypothetical protein